jgi:flagellar assembly protein FliH
MGAAPKFMFNVDFGPAAEVKSPAIPAAEHAAALAEAEARGYRAGMTAAEAQSRTEAERRQALAFERIANGVEQLRASLKQVEDRFEAEAVEVALAVGRKLAAELIAKEPFAEITALADQCFREMISAPHIVVRVNTELYSDAKQRLEDLVRARGFEGRLVVMSEGDIAPGDCRIEWADGGVVLERAAIEAKINELVGRYMASRDQAGRP